MPYSPFTRLMAVLLVLGYALGVLYPDDRAYVWGWYAMSCLPVLLAVFVWTSVKDAPPFDDQAFHRSLPPGPGYVFWTVLRIFLVVLVGIAVAVGVYCQIFHFGWRAISFGIAALTLPVFGYLAACAIAASVASSREHTKIWGWLAVLAVPVFSAAIADRLVDPSEQLPQQSGLFYFSHFRTMTAAGVILYPLIWWLIAVRDRRALGMAFVVLTGFLMPWLYLQGDFFPLSEAQLSGRDRSPDAAPVLQFSRSEIKAGSVKGVEANEILKVTGLGPDDLLEVWWGRFGSKEWQDRQRRLQTFEVSGDPSSPESKWRQEAIFFTQSGKGGALAGRMAMWDRLRNQLPPQISFGYWGRPEESPSVSRVLLPGEGVENGIGWNERKVNFAYDDDITLDEVNAASWNLECTTYKISKPLVFDLAKGGHAAKPGGGSIWVNPLHREGNHFTISIRLYLEDLWQADGPWGEATDDWWGKNPMAILYDEVTRQAFAIDTRSWRWTDDQRVMLGQRGQFNFYAGAADSPENSKRMEMLQRCKIYLFMLSNGHALLQAVPPPK